MGDQPINHKDVQVTPQGKEFLREGKADMSEYIMGKSGHDQGSVMDSGHRLQAAAKAFEDTRANDPAIKQLADEILAGTPGTPKWDKLMETVSKQMQAIDHQIGQVSNGMTDTRTRLGGLNDHLAASNVIPQGLQIVNDHGSKNA